MVLSLFLSVPLSVTSLSQFSSHRIIMNFVRSKCHNVCEMFVQKDNIMGHRARSQSARQILPQYGHLLNHNSSLNTQIATKWCKCLMWHRRGDLLFLTSSAKFWDRTGQGNAHFDSNWEFPEWNFSFNLPMSTKWCTELEIAYSIFWGRLSYFKVARDFTGGYKMAKLAQRSMEVVPYCFRSHRQNSMSCGPKYRSVADLSISIRQLKFEFMGGYEMTHIASWNLEEVPYCFSTSALKFEGKAEKFKISVRFVQNY